MKRITTIPAPSSIPNSKKPIYVDTSCTNGPYYDPFHIHIHRWVINHLEFSQLQDSPEFSNSRKVNKIVKYCEICHELCKTNKLSTTEITPVERINNTSIKMVSDDDEYEDAYEDYEDYYKEKEEKKEEKKVEKEVYFDNLFYPTNKITSNYVTDSL
jgi:hypothetical protein